MPLHPLLRKHENSKHIHFFDHIFRMLDKQLKRKDMSLQRSEIITTDFGRSDNNLYSGTGYGEIEEVLLLKGSCHGCPTEVAIPIGKGGVAPPYTINIILPRPIQGKAVYRRGMFGSTWQLDKKNAQHIKDLKRIIPNPHMSQSYCSRLVPVSVSWDIEVGHLLQPYNSNHTQWTVESGYEGGLFSGGGPEPSRYLAAIPKVINMLEEWNH